MEDTTVLVQVADEFARKKFGVGNDEVWKLVTYSLKKNSLVLNYTNFTGIAVAVTVDKSLLEEMAQKY